MNNLSPREREVARMAAKSNAEIGRALGISTNTVKIHIQKAYDKLSIHGTLTPRATVILMAERGEL